MFPSIILYIKHKEKVERGESLTKDLEALVKTTIKKKTHLILFKAQIPLELFICKH